MMHVQSCFCANLTSCFFAVLADVSVVVAPYLFILFSRASPLIFIAGATNGKGDTGNELEKITMDQTLSSSPSSSLAFFFFNLFSCR